MTYWAVAEHGHWRSYKDKATSVTAGLGSSLQDRLEPDGLTHAALDDAPGTLCGLLLEPTLRRFDYATAVAALHAYTDPYGPLAGTTGGPRAS